MSVSTVTNLSNSLRRTYSDRYFKAMQQDYTPILDELDECPDEPTYGVGWFFPFYLSAPQNWRMSAEGGGMGTVGQRSEVQGQVNSVEFLGYLQISEKLKNVGIKSASWNGGEINRQMKEAMFVITRGQQRMFSISHGTGRIAVVQDDVTSGNTFVAKLDEGVNALEEQEYVDFYDLDSGGTPQVTSRLITKIVRRTRTVTFDGAAAALTANWGVYKAGDYGRAVNGIHGMIDNGIFQDSVHGQSRATYEKLKSYVVDPGTPTPLEEAHVQDLFDGIYYNGGEPTGMFCDIGVMNAVFALQAGDRRYNVERGKGPMYVGGYKEGDLLWSYDKGSYVVRKNPQLPKRTLYVHSLKTSFYKHTTKKLGWLDEGGSILRLTPDSGSDGFKTSWTALVYADTNISCFAPLWNAARRNVADATAGD